MDFYELDYLDYARARDEGYAEFDVDDAHGHLLESDLPRCISCGVAIGSLRWLSPYYVTLTPGKIGDLCTDGDEILVSRRFRTAWESSGLSGFSFSVEPVQIVRRPKADARRPIELLVAEPCFAYVRLDEAASGLVVDRLLGCDHCRVASRQKVDRLRLDASTWRGEDVFRPTGLYGVVLVTERFVAFVREHGFTNFHFVHQNDFREPRPEAPRC